MQNFWKNIVSCCTFQASSSPGDIPNHEVPFQSQSDKKLELSRFVLRMLSITVVVIFLLSRATGHEWGRLVVGQGLFATSGIFCFFICFYSFAGSCTVASRWTVLPWLLPFPDVGPAEWPSKVGFMDQQMSTAKGWTSWRYVFGKRRKFV